jgi:hypothetical protein
MAKKTKEIDVPAEVSPLRLFTKQEYEWRKLPEAWGYDASVEMRPFNVSERAIFEQLERKSNADAINRAMIECGLTWGDVSADEEATEETKNQCEINWKKVETQKKISVNGALEKDDSQFELLAKVVRKIRINGVEQPFDYELLRQAETILVEWIIKETYTGSNLLQSEVEGF